MSRALLFLLLGGCWPLIPGPYSEYADDTGSVDTDGGDAELPAGSAILGFVEWGEVRGNYWQDAADGDLFEAQALWGISLEGSVDPLTPYDGGPCHQMPDWDWTTEWAPFDGADESVLSGAEDYTLRWQSNASAYALRLREGEGFPEGLTWDLEPTDTEWGTLAVVDMVRTPTPATLDTPDLGGTDSEGTQPDTVAKSDLAFTWSGHSGEAIILQLITIDEGNNLVDAVSCVRRSGSGIDVPPGVFTDLESAVGAYVYFGTAVESEGTVAGADHRVAGIQWQQGFVYFE